MLCPLLYLVQLPHEHCASSTTTELGSYDLCNPGFFLSVFVCLFVSEPDHAGWTTTEHGGRILY